MLSADKKEQDSILVGVNYFSGWWRPSPNKYEVHGSDWRLQYPERIPMLGCYNDQDTMDAEIVAAARYGVDFFQMLWYVQDTEREPHARNLNNGLHQFMNSKESARMRFMIEFCNHPPYEIADDALWEQSCDEWIGMMKHDSYLRIAGKAMFKIHGLLYFYEQCGRSTEKMEERLSLLRAKADQAGVGPLCIGAGVMPGDDPQGEIAELGKYVDHFSTYMDVPALPVRDHDYAYGALLQQAEHAWHRYGALSATPYIPYVPAGWNPKPWHDPRPSFAFPSSEEWEEALLKVKHALDSYEKLRIPDGGSGQKVVTIYAWNEFGEGGIVAPTIGERYRKLEGIQRCLK